MKTKQVFILGIIFLVLIFAVILKEMQKPAELTTQEYVPLDLSFDIEKVAKIDISRLQDKEKDEEQYIELAKQDGKWKVRTFYDARADENKITNFLDEIQNAKGEMRAQNKDVYEDFGITDDEAFKIALLDTAGSSLFTLRLGSVKNRGRSIFVRKNDEERVYMTDADIFGKMGIYGKPEEAKLGTDYWADLRLSDYDTVQVTSVETKTFDEDGVETLRTHVIKEDGTWKYVRKGLPFEMDPNKVTQHLDSLKGWRAQKMLEPDTEDLGFENPRWQMKIGMQGGENIILKAGNMNEEAKAYYIYVSSEPAPFQLTHFYFENLSIDDSRFFKNNPLELNASNVERLVISSESNTYEFAPATKVWQELTDYINQLSNFRAQSLIVDKDEIHYTRSPSMQYIEIKKVDEEEPLIVDIGEQISEESKEYAVAIRGKDGYPFILKGSDVTKYFEGFDKIMNAEPADEPEAPVDARIEDQDGSEGEVAEETVPEPEEAA